MQHKKADIVCTLLNISRHLYYTLSLFKIQHVCYNNFKPGVITPSISQRGQRAHEKISRGRGRSEKKRKYIYIYYSARHASRHLAQRLGEETKHKNKKLQHSPRGHTREENSTATRGEK